MKDIDDTADRRTESECEAGIERRMELRILRLWWDARRDNEFPSLEALSEQEIDRQWPAIVLLAVPDGGGEPVFERIGEDYADDLGADLIGKAFSEAREGTVLRRLFGYYGEVLEDKVPVTVSGEITDKNGDEMRYRSIILPLGDNIETINFLLCAASFTKPESIGQQK